MRQRVGIVALVALLTLAAAQTALADSADLGISRDPRNAKYSDVLTFMAALSAGSGGVARVVRLGDSDSGETIQALAIGSGPVKNLIVASHHGNEYGSVEVARALAASLVERPIPGQTVYVVPVLNIAGYDLKSRRESAGSRSFDPNRNYPGPCGTEGPFSLRSTRALANFVEREGIVASATLHTFYPAVVYPWGFTTRDLSTPYDDLFKSLVQAATVESGYPTGNSTEEIYPANGTYEDYVFWKHGVWSVLFELGRSHSPVREAVVEMARVNVPGIRRMLEQAPRERAERHGFTGQCDPSLRVLDRHDE